MVTAGRVCLAFLCPEGRSGAGRSWLQRKWQTSRSFLRNVRFARTYAPREAFWLFTDLLRNNLRSTKTDN